MICSTTSFVLEGITAQPCRVEVSISVGQLMGTTVVGLPDAAVRESIERVRSAIRNCGYRWPEGWITINLAPASVRKEGPVYDLPIAIAVLAAGRTIDPVESRSLDQLFMAGELALDGSLRRVRGATALATLARREGGTVVVPEDNACEALIVPETAVRVARTLPDVVQWLHGDTSLIQPDPPELVEDRSVEDFSDVLARENVKRACVVAAAGWHNMLMLGPPGTGKSMIAKCIPGILPELSADQVIDVLQIRACRPEHPGTTISPRPPFRRPHHTASAAAILGGGSLARPGEVSLAHHGVLFLDELPEFSRLVLEGLRQPLEDRRVVVARAATTIEYPANCLVIAAMNPTRDGRAPGRRGADAFAKLSAPLLDRLDLQIEFPRVPFSALRRAETGRTTDMLREQVRQARSWMTERQGDRPNGLLSGADLDSRGQFKARALDALEEAMRTLDLSARAWNRLRRVARTIADLDHAEWVDLPHVDEAVGYRTMGPNSP